MKNNTLDKKEIEKFSKIAEEWWNPTGKFKPLHKFNPIRIKYIKDNLINDFDLINKKKPLDGLKILDIGCGGGLLSEPMARLGAKVTGIDPVKKNIEIAKHHLKRSKLDIKYFNFSPEKFKSNNKYDVILNMEIVEHVENVDFFIKQSAKFLKKSGIMFIATLNQTLKSFLFAIVGAEYILKWLPIGTHDWQKFIKPAELIAICKKNSLNLKSLDGISFNPIIDKWNISVDKSVNYIAKFKKN
jgi:2-polyprenyl-6-hydroxyphenyl methylase/3-demethylubiquinone-9 3-methyltransferase